MKRWKQGIKVFLVTILSITIFISTLSVPVKAEAKQYITRGQFIQLVAKAIKLSGTGKTEAAAIQAALQADIINQKTFSSYDAYLNRSDAAVILVRADEYLHGENIEAELLQTIAEQRLSDLSKASAARRPFIVKCYALGFITGNSNGAYSKDRKFNPSTRVSITDAKSLVEKLTNATKRDKISPDGQLIRITNLPSNAKMYPYILDSFPNEYYDWEFQFMKWERDGKPLYGTKEKINLIDYAAPVDLMKFDKGRLNTIIQTAWPTWEKQVTDYLMAVFNANYKIIKEDKKWFNIVFSNCSQYDTLEQNHIERRINSYLSAMIKNKTVVECDKVAFDRSSLYIDSAGGVYLRLYVHYRIKSSIANPENAADFFGVSPIIYTYFNWIYLDKAKLGEWRDGYFDIELGTGKNLGVYELILTDSFYLTEVVKEK